MKTDNTQRKTIILFLVALTCILTGGIIGALTNMVNGAVSPYYFKTIMHWDFENIWSASVAQGIFEGLLNGVLFSIIFTTTFGIVTKGKATYKFAFRQLVKVAVIVLCCFS